MDADCFNRDPEIAAWMAQNGMTDTDAYAYFTQRVGAMAKVQGTASVSPHTPKAVTYREPTVM